MEVGDGTRAPASAASMVRSASSTRVDGAASQCSKDNGVGTCRRRRSCCTSYECVVCACDCRRLDGEPAAGRREQDAGGVAFKAGRGGCWFGGHRCHSLCFALELLPGNRAGRDRHTKGKGERGQWLFIRGFGTVIRVEFDSEETARVVFHLSQITLLPMSSLTWQ